MEEERNHWFRRLLKPNVRKVAIFIILFGILIYLPLYPTSTYKAYSANLADIEYYSSADTYTTLESLFSVLKGDFEWASMEYDGYTGLNPNYPGPTMTVYNHDANPLFISLYIFYGTVAYILGCMIVTGVKFSERGIKDL